MLPSSQWLSRLAGPAGLMCRGQKALHSRALSALHSRGPVVLKSRAPGFVQCRGLTKKRKSWFQPSAGPGPPYRHMVQLGDPVLRQQCDPVARDQIGGRQVQDVLAAMQYTLDRSVVDRSAPLSPAISGLMGWVSLPLK